MGKRYEQSQSDILGLANRRLAELRTERSALLEAGHASDVLANESRIDEVNRLISSIKKAENKNYDKTGGF